MQKFRTCAFAATCVAALSAVGGAQAATVTIDMHLAAANGPGKEIGTIEFEDTPDGMTIRPRLMHLQEGLHGFHLDQFPSCAAKDKNGEMIPALAAGEPLGSGGKDPLGNLPGLYVHYDGAAYTPTITPRLKTSDLFGHAIVIDALGAGYSDAPKPVGGAIARVACGVVMH